MPLRPVRPIPGTTVTNIIIHCPTDDMIGDYFTKPLQGAKFIKFRNLIMGIDDDHTSVKERVEGTEAHNVVPQ